MLYDIQKITDSTNVTISPGTQILVGNAPRSGAGARISTIIIEKIVIKIPGKKRGGGIILSYYVIDFGLEFIYPY